MSEFKLEIPQDIAGKKLAFDSVSEFQSWINQERSSFEWVSQVKRNFSNQVWNHVVQQFSGASSQINAITQNIQNKSPIQGNLDALQNWFKNTYQSKKLILSTSSEFKAILDLKAESPLKASVFLGHLLSVPNLYSNGVEAPEMIDAAGEYFQYTKGLSKKDLSAEKQALMELKKSWDDHLTEYKTQEDQLKEQFESINTNFDEFFTDARSSLEAHLKKNTEDLDELKKTYNQYMALKAPVDYWQAKRKKHHDNASMFKWWSIGVGILGSSAFSFSVLHVFSDNQISYWKISIFVLLGTLFFWSLRVLMKLMLSNIHLESDAHEREVMCQTYLSLLREQTGLNDNDKKLILSTLFRPSSSGIVGDDGIPPGIYDVITKIASR